MSKTLRVTGQYVTLKIQDPNLGTFIQGYYEGALVQNVEDESARHHLEVGLAVDASADDMPAAPPLLPDLAELGSEPGGNASHEEWQTFARSKGATDEDLVGEDGKPLSRNELRARYGSL